MDSPEQSWVVMPVLKHNFIIRKFLPICGGKTQINVGGGVYLTYTD